jgi:hypothetical protein
MQSDTQDELTYATANTVVPDELQLELLGVRENLRENYFRVGDIADLCIRENAKRNHGFTQQSIFDAIGRIIGKSGRTVRYYWETATFYPEDVRDDFMFVPFSHFVIARYCGERWIEVMEHAFDNPLISRDGLQAWVDAKIYGVGATQENVASPNAGTVGIPSKIGEFSHAPQNTSKARHAHVLLLSMGDLIDNISELLKEFDEDDLGDGVRTSFEETVKSLRALSKVVERRLLADVLEDEGCQRGA